MKRRIIALLLLGALLSQATAQTSDLRARAKALVGEFAGQLKPALQQAFRETGPAAAIEVCSTKAPAIAVSLSDESGWTVRRVSLKPRNVETATPKDWARDVLESFEQRREAGEAVSTMLFDAVVDGEYRFLKPQGVEPLCLNCHGTSIAPEVARELKRFYPNDRATGYSLGDIRGAFYLTKSIDPQ